MKAYRSFSILAISALLFVIPALAGCAPKQGAANTPIAAIEAIRSRLELPQLALKFVEMTFMANSPARG